MDEINFLHDLKVELEAYESDAPCFDKHLHEIISSVHNRLAELRAMRDAANDPTNGCAGCGHTLAANDSCRNCVDHMNAAIASGPVTEPVIESDLPPVVHVSTASGTATYTDPKLVG